MKLNSNKYTIIIKSEQKPAEHDIINFPMYPIINISFNGNSMSWELINFYLIHTYDSVMK